MISTSRFTFLLSASLAFAGCNLDDGDKTACSKPADCLDGFVCVQELCIDPELPPVVDAGAAQTDADDHETELPPDAGAFEYGTADPMEAQSVGLATANYDTIVGATTVDGLSGCALVADEFAAPGSAGAIAYAKVHSDSGDARCPDGVYGIRNDSEACGSLYQWPEGLPEGCALYKRWDAAGTQAANRLATGGAVSIRSTELSDTDVSCDVELALIFAGGTRVDVSYNFHYDPFGAESSFCLP